TSRFQNRLASHPSEPFENICFSANTGRSHFAHRLTVAAATSREAFARLTAFEAGRGQTGISKGSVEEGGRPHVAFLYSGQGSQYAGMGKRLYDTQPTFRAALQRCDELFRPALGESLLSVMYPEAASGSRLDQTAFAHPAMFALELALTELWRSWGIRP